MWSNTPNIVGDPNASGVVSILGGGGRRARADRAGLAVRKTLVVVMEVDLGEGRALRPLDDADAEELFALIDANRAHLAHWMPFVGQTRGAADSLAFVRAARRQYEENRGMQLALVQ